MAAADLQWNDGVYVARGRASRGRVAAQPLMACAGRSRPRGIACPRHAGRSNRNVGVRSEIEIERVWPDHHSGYLAVFSPAPSVVVIRLAWRIWGRRSPVCGSTQQGANSDGRSVAAMEGLLPCSSVALLCWCVPGWLEFSGFLKFTTNNEQHRPRRGKFRTAEVGEVLSGRCHDQRRWYTQLAVLPDYPQCL